MHTAETTPDHVECELAATTTFTDIDGRLVEAFHLDEPAPAAT
jgi:hypothetical protein